MGARRDRAEHHVGSGQRPVVGVVFADPEEINSKLVGTNTLLDVIVGGCKVLIISAINPTQPDQTDPTVTFPAGTTAPYKLSASSATTHVVDTCKDSSSPAQTVPAGPR